MVVHKYSEEEEEWLSSRLGLIQKRIEAIRSFQFDPHLQDISRPIAHLLEGKLQETYEDQRAVIEQFRTRNVEQKSRS